MRNLYIRMVLCAVTAFSPVIVKAQTPDKVDIIAIVRGAGGKPISGAVISNAGSSANTMTDSLGTFSLQVPSHATLSVSAPGYETVSVEATQGLNEISLASDKSAEPVQVAFRKVDREDLLGGVSAVSVPEILEENYYTNGLDGLEAYIGGYNGNSIWGMDSYLVLVDGIPRDAGSVVPTEIAQVTFLKGVSAVALYGSRAAKGVVYITTKRGVAQDQQIKVRVNAGVFVPKSYPKYLGSAEYMTLYNEARRNDGLEELYSEETIYNHASGSNPYRYPNVDYYSSDYLKDTYNRYDGTIEIAGGNEQARYYTNVGFNSAGSLLNFGEAKGNGNERFNIRGNVDLDLNEYIYAKVDAAAIYNSGRGVNANFWNGVSTLRPNRFSPLIPVSMIEESDEASWQLINNSNNLIDGKFLLGGTQLDQNNPLAGIYAGGNNKYTSRQFQFNTVVGANLSNVLEGLSFQSNFGVDYSTSYNQSFNNNYAVYQATWNNYAGYDQISSLTKFGEDSKTGVQNINNSWYRQTIAFSGQFNYLKTVNDRHHFSSMLIANGFQQSESAVYHKTSNANLGLHVGYDFQEKYYAEFNGALVHSARLPEGNREAFSPTLTLGWRISEEDFMQGVAAVDNLKLSVSGGVLHTDLNIPGYYLYQSIYTQTDGAWYSWRDGALNRTTDARRGENLDLTFSKREEVNVSLEGTLFKNSVTFAGSLFANRMTGNAVQASVLYPSYFTTGWPNSSFIPYVNYDNDQRLGGDLNVSLNKRMGGVDWRLGMSATYYDTKATKRAEMYADEYQRRQGRPLDAIWGLQSDGFFQNQADIDGSPSQTFGPVKPGDIKYIDQNGDGTINAQDEVYLGKAGWYGSPLTLGVHLSGKWHNFTVFALGVGRFGGHALKNSSYFWVDGEDKYSEVVRDRWTEGTMNTATYPRLTTLSSDNNFRSSDFWLYSTNRFDLAKVQVSYDLPARLLQNTFIREWGVYLSGSNLLTVSPEREVMELNIGSSPQTRFYNFGVKALF